MTSLTDYAMRLAAAGVSVIPVLCNGSKAAAVRWAPFQRRIASAHEIREMFTGDVGIAAIGGEVSGGLEALDIEAGAPAGEWEQLVRKTGGDAVLGRLVVVATPSGGRHYV